MRLRGVIVVLMLSAVAAVAACGKKGNPVLPDGQTDTYQHSYPASTAPQTGVFSN